MFPLLFLLCCSSFLFLLIPGFLLFDTESLLFFLFSFSSPPSLLFPLSSSFFSYCGGENSRLLSGFHSFDFRTLLRLERNRSPRRDQPTLYSATTITQTVSNRSTRKSKHLQILVFFSSALPYRKSAARDSRDASRWSRDRERERDPTGLKRS